MRVIGCATDASVDTSKHLFYIIIVVTELSLSVFSDFGGISDCKYLKKLYGSGHQSFLQHQDEVTFKTYVCFKFQFRVKLNFLHCRRN